MFIDPYYHALMSVIQYSKTFFCSKNKDDYFWIHSFLWSLPSWVFDIRALLLSTMLSLFAIGHSAFDSSFLAFYMCLLPKTE
jgi:hypothetical protein